MLIIPSIDLRGGRTVRLLHGDYAKETVYDADPVRTAVSFQEQGAQVIHVVDLDGAKTGVPENLPMLERIFRAVSVTVEVGGGVRTLETAQRLLDAGAGRVVLGTALVSEPELAERIFAALGDRAVAGIDARGGKAAVAGWIDQSSVDALELARRMQNAGAARVIVTDIARDGALTGPNVEFLSSFIEALSIPVIASGGVSSLGDLSRLAPTGAEGAIVGRALYEGKFTVREAVTILS
jgi:phosphoribosylformimino-5-aminoimidazole carboxamide ribotide isomerase